MLRKKKYFSTIRRGEISEWKKELTSNREYLRKEAVKKVVAAMTVGKDVGVLFTEVINCSQTNNVELKKLVYLYMMNYAPQNHDLAILAVSSLIKDISHENALIRGLALRTMSSMGIPEILEYLTEPLKASLCDDDPYVRKVAALAVSKYFLRSPGQAIEFGLIEDLEKLLRDKNATVISNAVVALCEICQNAKSSDVTITFTQKTLDIILRALELTSEWGQVHILDALAAYQPPNGLTSDKILEKVVPRLQHSNPAVIMSGVKVILNYWDVRGKTYTEQQLQDKIKKPIITLVNLSSKPELQYVILKNISIILTKLPRLMANQEAKLFFCVFDEPYYVKKEKLKILVDLVTPSNVDILLLELRNYVNEVDIDFVRASIETIGKVVLKLPSCIGRVIPILIDIIRTKIHYSVQQSIVVLRDILRKYPGNHFTKVIKLVFENLDVIDDEKAKSSTIWIVGEYYHLLSEGHHVLELFTNAFREEPESVQMEILNCCMKVFLKHASQKTREILENVMTVATEECSNADLRDKSYFYYRLLQQRIAKKVLIGDDDDPLREEEEGEGDDDDDKELKETIEKEKERNRRKNSEKEKQEFLKLMIPNLNSITSVLRTEPVMFIPGYQPLRIIPPSAVKKKRKKTSSSAQEKKKSRIESSSEEETEEMEEMEEPEEEEEEEEEQQQQATEGNLLMFGEEVEEKPKPKPKPPQNAPKKKQKRRKKRKAEEQSERENEFLLEGGLGIKGEVFRKDKSKPTNQSFFYRLHLTNHTDETYRGFQVKIRKNIFGLSVVEKGFWRFQVPPPNNNDNDDNTNTNRKEKIYTFEYPLCVDDENGYEKYKEDEDVQKIHIATRDHNKVVRKFSTTLDFSEFFGDEQDNIGQQELVSLWRSLGKENERKICLKPIGSSSNNNMIDDEELVKSLLKSLNVHFVGGLTKDNGDVNWYYYAVIHVEKDERFVVAEVRKRKVNGKVYLSTRAHPKCVIVMFEKLFCKVLGVMSE